MHYINNNNTKTTTFKYSVKVKIHCSMNIFGPKSGHFVKGVKSTRFIIPTKKMPTFVAYSALLKL